MEPLLPLLLLPHDAARSPSADARVRVLTPDDADLALAIGAVHAAFDGSDDVVAEARSATTRS